MKYYNNFNEMFTANSNTFSSVVFNDLSSLEETANSYGFELIKDYDTGNEISYSLKPYNLGFSFDELSNAIETCNEARENNPHWYTIHTNRLANNSKTYGTSIYEHNKTKIKCMGYLPYQLKQEGKFKVFHAKQTPEHGMFINITDITGRGIGNDSWGDGYNLYDVIEGLDFYTDGFGAVPSLLGASLNQFCEEARATIQIAEEYKKFLARKQSK
jgi:hypothetical protein